MKMNVLDYLTDKQKLSLAKKAYKDYEKVRDSGATAGELDDAFYVFAGHCHTLGLEISEVIPH